MRCFKNYPTNLWLFQIPIYCHLVIYPPSEIRRPKTPELLIRARMEKVMDTWGDWNRKMEHGNNSSSTSDINFNPRSTSDCLMVWLLCSSLKYVFDVLHQRKRTSRHMDLSRSIFRPNVVNYFLCSDKCYSFVSLPSLARWRLTCVRDCDLWVLGWVILHFHRA